MTGFPSVETAVECMKNGASDYMAKPLDLEYLNIALFNKLISIHKSVQVTIAVSSSESSRQDILKSIESKEIFDTKEESFEYRFIFFPSIFPSLVIKKLSIIN